MISIQNLNKSFGSFAAVKDLSIEIPQGELFGFLGPNGAGKTTTLKMAVGLLKPTSGSVTVGEYNVESESRAAKQITGYIPDTPYVYPQLTVEEYLDFVEELYGLENPQCRRIREEYFDKFRLGDWHQDLIKNLSHGMKQKMLFTGIFMIQPEVMVIDEPMVGLDPESARILKSSLRREVNEKDTAILLSTHSLEVAQQICDRVGILCRGELLTQGPYRTLRRTTDESLEDVFLRITGETSQALQKRQSS